MFHLFLKRLFQICLDFIPKFPVVSNGSLKETKEADNFLLYPVYQQNPKNSYFFLILAPFRIKIPPILTICITTLLFNRLLRIRHLSYYATFKVRNFDLLFCKINTCYQKNQHFHWIAGRANILCKYLIYIFSTLSVAFTVPFLSYSRSSSFLW